MASGNLATKIPVAVINSSAMMIVCKHCGVEKLESDFYGHTRSQCKACFRLIQKRYLSDPENLKKRKEYLRRYREEHKDEIIKSRQDRRAIHNAYTKQWNKEKRKTSLEFKLRSYETTRQWRKLNRAKLNEYDKKWREKNPEKWKLFQAHQTAIRRARIKSVAIGHVSYREILKRDGYNCHICGGRVAKKDLSFDHLIPISRGGSHTQKNIAVAHLVCNLKRGAGRLPAQLRLLD